MQSRVCLRWIGLLLIAFCVSAPLVAQKDVEGKIATPPPKDAYEKPQANLIVEPVHVGPRNPALYVPYRGGDFSPADGDVVVVDVTGTPSYDSAGASCNIRMTIPAPAGRDNFNGIGWDVTLTAFGASWRCEIAVLITNVNGDGYILRPGVADCSAGTGFYSSGGVGKLCDRFGLSDLPLPDGNLYLEFYETYNDYPGCVQDGNWDSGTISFQFGTTPPPDWHETADGGGDAGDLSHTAQLITRPNAGHCQTPVQSVQGNLDASDADMYVICITDPATFVARTVCKVAWDTQLFLFRCDGTGVVHNDDAVGTTGLQSHIDNTAGCITEGGIYLLAISRYNRDPVDANGQLIWNNTPFRSLRCPDGPGAANPIAGWTGTTTPGSYVITLQGAHFVLPGDVDCNGCIDDADLLAVLFAFGQSGSGLREDVNRDGIVDDGDLLEVLFNFGSGC